jgi:hypothetical protein
MLSFTSSEEKQSQCFHLLGTVKPTSGCTHLITENTALIAAPSLFSDGCEDSCSFYSGPSDATILSFGEQAESCGSIAYESSESCGSIAFSGGSEVSACASSCSSSSGGSFSGGGCSYSC